MKKKDLRTIRKMRHKDKLLGTAKRPRVSVFRSNKYMYVQLIDDDKKITLIGVGDKSLPKKITNKLEQARALGSHLAGLAKKKQITTAVFDRSGYAYHGRIKALAEALREGGIKI